MILIVQSVAEYETEWTWRTKISFMANFILRNLLVWILCGLYAIMYTGTYFSRLKTFSPIPI